MFQGGRPICFGCMHVRVLAREFVAQEMESLNSQEGWESEKWCRLVSSWATVLFSTWWLIMPRALSTFPWNLSAYFFMKLIFHCRIRKPSRCFHTFLKKCFEILGRFNFCHWFTASNPALCYSFLYCEISLITWLKEKVEATWGCVLV